MRTDGTSIIATDWSLPLREFLVFIGLPETHKLKERFLTKRGNARGGALYVIRRAVRARNSGVRFSAKAARPVW
jgi:hypothetical protein